MLSPEEAGTSSPGTATSRPGHGASHQGLTRHHQAQERHDQGLGCHHQGLESQHQESHLLFRPGSYLLGRTFYFIWGPIGYAASRDRRCKIQSKHRRRRRQCAHQGSTGGNKCAHACEFRKQGGEVPQQNAQICHSLSGAASLDHRHLNLA